MPPASDQYQDAHDAFDPAVEAMLAEKHGKDTIAEWKYIAHHAAQFHASQCGVPHSVQELREECKNKFTTIEADINLLKGMKHDAMVFGRGALYGGGAIVLLIGVALGLVGKDMLASFAQRMIGK